MHNNGKPLNTAVRNLHDLTIFVNTGETKGLSPAYFRDESRLLWAVNDSSYQMWLHTWKDIFS